MERFTLRWVKGDSLRLEVLLEDETGADLNLAGTTATWTISGTPAPVTVREAEGVIALNLTPAMTNTLREGAHELRITTANGDTHTILAGSARRARS